MTDTAPLYRLKIETDQDARNPREDGDYADIMYCEHRRYTLGDKDADKPVYEASFVTLEYQRADGTTASYVLDDDDNDHELHLSYGDVLDMLDEHRDELDEELADATDDTSALAEPDVRPIRLDAQRAAEACRYVRSAKWESEYRQVPGIAIIRDLSLYDHSGITIFAGAPTCRWDSGQVGWQYITEAKLQEEWNGDREKALAYMDSTLKEYDDYLRGHVYGFMLEKGTPYIENKTFPGDNARDTSANRIKWEHEDSCWGFVGCWWEKGDPTGMREHLPREVEALFDSMDYTDEGTWKYTDNVPEELQ